MSDRLAKLKETLAQLNRLYMISELLYWDMRTIMPEGGFEGHAEATEHYQTEAFRISTSDELYELLQELSAPEEWEQLDDDWRFIVKTMREEQERDRRIPEELFSRMVAAQTASERAWEEAKKNSDYSIFAPHLEKLIALTREVKSYTHPELEIYDALLDDYEKGMDSATIDRVFGELKEGLVPLVHSILAAEQPDDTKFRVTYDLDAQRKVQKLLLTYIGFDWSKGTVGESEHPFTLDLSATDVRVTNHFREDNAIDPMFSAIHEGGHAIFEQNVPPSWRAR